MKDTCNPESCKLHELIGGEPAHCPNYVESFWTDKDGQQALIRDCAPKRTLIMLQELFNQQIRLQAAQEEQRNQSGQVLTLVGQIMQKAALTAGKKGIKKRLTA